jgi:peptidoglycan-associated lipoprotein
MNRGWNNRKLLLLLCLTMTAALVMMAGCGGDKPPVEDEATIDQQPVEELPPPPVSEDTTPEEPAGPDYGSMEPGEYGVQDVFFAFDEYELTNEAMGILSANARIIREADTPILISGHCDERGTIEYNLALGEKRANAVRDYLVSLGVPAAQLRVTSYGENRPFATGSNESAWAQNRRAHFQRP